MKTRLHIVGLRYHSWHTRMAEIFANPGTAEGTWMGQKLFLQRDHQCAEDAHAVMAWTVTEAVGHVCKADLPHISPVMEQGGLDLVVTQIVGLDIRRSALVVEPVDELPEVACETPARPQWAWHGPVMPLPEVWAQADHFGRMMALMAKGDMPYSEEVVSRYMQCTVTDLSGDAYAARTLLAQTLLHSTDPRLAETGHELLAVMDHMGSTERIGDWHRQMSATLAESPKVHAIANRYAEADMQQMLAALRSFPLEIGCEWLAGNIELFIRRLYYAQIPRTEILQLLSLIVLYTSALRRMSGPVSAQPAIGVSLGGACQLSVGTMDNHGTVLSIDQARIFPPHLK